MQLTSIEILNLWGQDKITLNFDQRVTFLTGINGCGKSSVLNIIYDSLNLKNLDGATSKNRFWAATAIFDNDTGAASSIFCIDGIQDHQQHFSGNEIVIEMKGVGGSEFVVQKSIAAVTIDNKKITTPTVQFGEMNYGFEINGILGSDILLKLNINIADFYQAPHNDQTLAIFSSKRQADLH